MTRKVLGEALWDMLFNQTVVATCPIAIFQIIQKGKEHVASFEVRKRNFVISKNVRYLKKCEPLKIHSKH